MQVELSAVLTERQAIEDFDHLVELIAAELGAGAADSEQGRLHL